MNFSPLKLSHLKETILTTAHRYPIIMVLQGIATLCALFNLMIFDFDQSFESVSFEGFRWALIIAAGLPLYVGYFLWFESQDWSMRLSRSLIFALTIALHIYIGQHIYQLSEDSNGYQEPFWMLSWLIIIHLFSVLLPFWNARPLADFWSFCYWMFSNFIASTFYIGLIYAGIALGLSAFQLLIYQDLDPKFYFFFLILLVGIFHPLFFLSSAPQDNQTSVMENALLRLQRVQQWILSPLVIIYLSILYLYAGKILFQASLPKGWVSIWILLFSCIGVLNWLLGQFFESTPTGSSWKITSRKFFWYLLPLIVLLWIAIGYRLLEYGLTEVRAIVVYLAVFLSINALYFGFVSKVKIIFLPLSLLIIALIYQNGGPLSAKSLSFSSQMKQWNQIKNAPNDNTYDDAKNVLRYLSSYHSEKAAEYCLQCDSAFIQPGFVNNYEWANEQLNESKLTFKEDTSEVAISSYVRVESKGPINILGYSECIPISNQTPDEYQAFGDEITAYIRIENVSDPAHQNERLAIILSKQSEVIHTAFIGNLQAELEKKIESERINGETFVREKFSIDFDFDGKSYRFVTSDIGYDVSEQKIYNIQGYLLRKN